jgi:hypothetical protein
MKKNQNNFFSEGLKYRKCINFNSKLCFNKECSKCKKLEITICKILFIFVNYFNPDNYENPIYE